MLGLLGNRCVKVRFLSGKGNGQTVRLGQRRPAQRLLGLGQLQPAQSVRCTFVCSGNCKTAKMELRLRKVLLEDVDVGGCLLPAPVRDFDLYRDKEVVVKFLTLFVTFWS
ncbi:hypothetical protein L596_027395 [Steinernema carpocapsae]|uniref:Uncharacterized protein n=1 Tax=Steinernema carpocapsae TaxID=34508 RepID=A0A4U5M5J9_STECR|nr:hypothetical protein L596_027395 [Steinernema carpocapsae]